MEREPEAGMDDSTTRWSENASPERLARMFGVNENQTEQWNRADKAAMLQHQLGAPIDEDLCGEEPTAESYVVKAAMARGIRTLRDLLMAKDPPPGVLRLAKDFFKTHAGSRDRTPEQELAFLLYISVILVAQSRGEVISKLKPKALSDAAKWAVGLDWLDPELRAVLKQMSGHHTR
jgi:hypothetical protein